MGKLPAVAPGIDGIGLKTRPKIRPKIVHFGAGLMKMWGFENWGGEHIGKMMGGSRGQRYVGGPDFLQVTVYSGGSELTSWHPLPLQRRTKLHR